MEDKEIEDLEEELEDLFETKVKGPKIERVDKNNEPKKEKKKKKINITLILTIVIVLAFIGIVLFFVFCAPTIKLNGEKTIKLTVGSDYVEENATAKFLGKDISKDIKIDGEVKTDKVGKYTITYKINKGLLSTKKTRTVEIVRNGSVITLEGDKETSICPKAKYEEIGFSATNSNEEDLKESVVSKVDKDLVTYKVKDKDGVMFVTTRKLIREDKEAPEIKLNGKDHMYVTLGFNFNDPKANVNDNCDGDLTEKLEVSGSVDTNTLGDYELTYKVKDEVGNESEAKRTVTVQKEIVKRTASLGCGEPGVIYLTFDDGPGGSTTSTILDILKRQGVKATFFVTSSNGGSDDLIKREFEEGHLIALHTNSHEYSQIYKSTEAYWTDLNKISDRVERITGKKSYFLRFPGGSSNTVSRHYSSGIMSYLANEVESKGYSYYDWNVDSRDAEGKNCEQVYHYATSGFSKSSGNVVLMHDIKQSTACALERIIEYGKNNGYTFKTLDSGVVCHHRTAN